MNDLNTELFKIPASQKQNEEALRNSLSREKSEYDYKKYVLFPESISTPWIETAKEVLKDLDFSEAASRFPRPVDIRCYPHPSLDGIGGRVFKPNNRMVMVLGIDVQPKSEGKVGDDQRRIFQHELGHTVGVSLIGKSNDPECSVWVSAKGFDRIYNFTGTTKSGFDYNRGVLSEPLADLFSYFCSDKLGKDKHELSGAYINEDAFVVSLLEKMAKANTTSVKTEFGLLFKAFSNRDFTWFKHLISSLEKSDLGQDQAREFAKKLNMIFSHKGRDISKGEELALVAKTGEFFNEFERIRKQLTTGGVVEVLGSTTKLA